MKLTRRQAIAAGAAAVATASLAQQPRPVSPDSLGALARRSGRRFGSAVAWSPPGTDAGSFTNPAYARLLEHDCELLVPENQLKWQWVRRSPDQFDFRAFDAIADYADAQGFKLRGHTLFWTPTKWYPKWLAETSFRLSWRGGTATGGARRDGLSALCRADLLLRCRERGGAARNGRNPGHERDACAGRRGVPRPDVPYRRAKPRPVRSWFTTTI